MKQEQFDALRRMLEAYADYAALANTKEPKAVAYQKYLLVREQEVYVNVKD